MRKKHSLVTVTVAAFFCLILVVGSGSCLYAKEVVWKMTTTWPPAINLIEADKTFAKNVNQLCKGKLRIKFYPGGSLMPGFEVFNAVSKGTIQAAGDWPNYWSGKDGVFDTLGSYPMGLTPIDYMVWIYEGGGLDIYKKAYGKFGMMYLPTGVTPSESGIRGNKPINSLKDIKGLKIRMSGKAQGYILKEVGAAQVLLAGGEVYQALQKGTVDGAEFSSPTTDWNMGLGEVTKYWASPGWHQPASVMGVMINQKAWDALDEDTKKNVLIASKAAFLEFFCFQYYGCIDGTKKFFDKGVNMTRYSDEDLTKIEKIVNKYTADTAAKNPLFRESIQSQIEFRKKFSDWRSIEEPFSFGYNPKDYPDVK